MSILQIKALSHDFGDKILFKNVNLEIFKNEHLGITGANGSGKSTFMKLLIGDYLPDHGQIIWHPDINIGHLDQYATIDCTLTIKDYLNSVYQKLYDLEKEMFILYEKYSLDNNEDYLNLAGKYQESLIASEFYTIDNSINVVTKGLGIDAIGLDKCIGEISGGQRVKVILAKLILEKPDVLLLDEPTNFLDSSHINWLVDYLNSFSGSYLVISHDFAFLEQITNCILDIDFETIKKYHGQYSNFVKQKEHLQADYLRRYQNQQEHIKKTEQFIRKNIAGNNTKIAQGRRKQLARLERLSHPNNTITSNFHFKNLSLSSKQILKVTDLTIGYKEPLLSRINFTLNAQEKIAITGFNGIGKSTLLKTLIKEIKPLSGNFIFNEQIQIAYYSQDLVWSDTSQNPLEIVHEHYPRLDIKTIRSKLAHFNITSDLIDKPIHQLSGGEQAKVKLCVLSLFPSHLLILDEPTNHLDKEIKMALANALNKYRGSVILVSHEQSFYKDLVDRIIRIEKYNN